MEKNFSFLELLDAEKYFWGSSGVPLSYGNPIVMVKELFHGKQIFLAWQAIGKNGSRFSWHILVAKFSVPKSGVLAVSSSSSKI